MRLPFYIVVMEVLAGLTLSLSYPLRWLSVDWADILMVIKSCEDGRLDMSAVRMAVDFKIASFAFGWE
jgi:hypothetical protein